MPLISPATPFLTTFINKVSKIVSVILEDYYIQVCAKKTHLWKNTYNILDLVASNMQCSYLATLNLQHEATCRILKIYSLIFNTGMRQRL